MDNFVVLPNGTSSKDRARKLNEMHTDTPFIQTVHIPTDTINSLELPKTLYKLLPMSYPSDKEHFKVVLGSQRDRRTMIYDMDVYWKVIRTDQSTKDHSASTDSSDSE